jgi:VWFA-related protein
MYWERLKLWPVVQILDSFGMKYAHLIALLVLIASAATTAGGQGSPYATLPSPALSATATAAGASSDNEDQSVLTIRKRVDEVHLLFTATDRHGRFVKNLSQGDFQILDDHKPPQSISEFRRETDLPLELGLVVDVSGSIRSRFTFEQDSAIAFMQHTLRPHFDKAFVMGFNGHPQIAQDFTDSAAVLAQGVHRLRAGGGTALYDAIYHACRDKLLNKGDSNRPVRHALIVLSDGDDNQSEVTREAAIEMAQRAEVIIFAISTDDSPTYQRGDRVLQQLADSTGGRAFFPLKVKDVARSFTSIEDELRSQYVVSYKPAQFDADGRFRSIELTSEKKDLSLRARRGYYAPRQ